MRPYKGPISTAGAEGGSTVLDRVINALVDVFDSLKKVVTNDVLVRHVFSAATTDSIVTHGLGFAPRTWEIVDQDANAVLWRSGTRNERPTQTLIMQASAPVTVVLRFT
jgi:hypothetical protein